MNSSSFIELEAGRARARVRLTPWDERSLGFRTAEIVELSADSAQDTNELLAQIDAWLHEQDVAYSFGRIGAEQADLKEALQAHGYRYVETSFRMSRGRTEDWPRTPASLSPAIRASQSTDLERLSAIAVEDFHHGRFLEDPTLAPRAARSRTGNWLRDLHSGGHLHTALRGDTIVGFAADSMNPETKVADLILYGVSADYPMLALPLWIQSLQRLNKQGVRRYQAIVSAANTGVINLYGRLGFQVAATYYGFRKWHRPDLISPRTTP